MKTDRAYIMHLNFVASLQNNTYNLKDLGTLQMYLSVLVQPVVIKCYAELIKVKWFQCKNICSGKTHRVWKGHTLTNKKIKTNLPFKGFY